MKKRTKKILVVSAVVLALLVAVTGFNILRARQQLLAQYDVAPKTAQASQGDIGVYVASSGNLYTAGETQVKAGTVGEVEKVEVSVGDVVEVGQILAVVEGKTLTDEIESLESQIYSQEIAIAQVPKSRERLYIKAEAEGTIKDIKAKAGDDVAEVMAEYGYLALLSLQDRQYVAVEAGAAEFLTKGAQLKVRRGDTVMDGVVEKIEEGTAYVLVETDRFTVGGRAYIYPENQYSDRVQGSIELYDYIEVKAYRGTISSVSCRENEEQILGATLFGSYSYYSQSVMDMYDQLDDLREQLAEKKLMLENLQIRAPHGGVVTACNLAAGDSIVNDALAAFTIADTSVWEAIVAVDELDINSVAVGQSAIVYVDALPGYEFEGTVGEISSYGTAVSGITSYQVKLRVPDEQGLFKLNMTVSADIQTAYAEHAVRIPIEALRESGGAFYVVRDAGRTEAQIEEIRSGLIQAGSSRKPAPDGGPDRDLYHLSIADKLYGEVAEVGIGIQNESYAEVLSGLAAGDGILLPDDGGDDAGMHGMFMFGPGR